MPRYSSRTGLLSTYQVGPYSATHVYVQWGGKLPGNESWSCGFRLWAAGGSTPADATDLLGPVSAAVAAFHGRAGSSIGTQALMSFCKVNAIALDGTYQVATTNEVVFADIPGGGFPSTHPNQVALAVSTTTQYSRGPAHRGRFYLPLPSLVVGSNGRISDANAIAVGVSADVLLAAVNAASPDHSMHVMSRKAGAPASNPVTGFEIGTVLDTQRRRRRSLVEGHQ